MSRRGTAENKIAKCDPVFILDSIFIIIFLISPLILSPVLLSLYSRYWRPFLLGCIDKCDNMSKKMLKYCRKTIKKFVLKYKNYWRTNNNLTKKKPRKKRKVIFLYNHYGRLLIMMTIDRNTINMSMAPRTHKLLVKDIPEWSEIASKKPGRVQVQLNLEKYRKERNRVDLILTLLNDQFQNFRDWFPTTLGIWLVNNWTNFPTYPSIEEFTKMIGKFLKELIVLLWQNLVEVVAPWIRRQEFEKFIVIILEWIWRKVVNLSFWIREVKRRIWRKVVNLSFWIREVKRRIRKLFEELKQLIWVTLKRILRFFKKMK